MLGYINRLGDLLEEFQLELITVDGRVVGPRRLRDDLSGVICVGDVVVVELVREEVSGEPKIFVAGDFGVHGACVRDSRYGADEM